LSENEIESEDEVVIDESDVETGDESAD